MSVKDIPNEFYMYQFTNMYQATEVKKSNPNISISQIANVLSCFDDKLNLKVVKDAEEFEIYPEKKFKFTPDEILFGFESNKFPQHREVENHFKRLLAIVIHNIFRAKGLRRYEMCNKRFAYYLPIYDKIQKIKFTYPYSSASAKPKSKNYTWEI